MKKGAFILFLFFSVVVNGQEFDTYKVEGEIKLMHKDDFYLLRAFVINKEVFFIEELDYNLVVLKKGVTGNYSKNNQSSPFSLEPEEEKELASVRINMKEGEEIKAYLFIKNKEKLIHRDTLFVGYNVKKTQQKKVSKQQNNEAQYLIKGIVIDEAITRIGKDYHDYFYREYLVSGRKYPYIITITEKPAFGRNSIIGVNAEGKKVHEFFAKPEEDYLKTNVVIAMRNLRTYNEKRKNTYKQM